MTCAHDAISIRARSVSDGACLPVANAPGSASLATFDHAEGIAALATRLAAQFVHQLSHEEHAASADAHLGRIEVRHGRQIEGGALVEQVDFKTLGAKETLNLKLRLGPILMSVTDDVGDSLVSRQDDGIGGRGIEPANLANRFKKGSGEDHLA
jgi:hypothetical protein